MMKMRVNAGLKGTETSSPGVTQAGLTDVVLICPVLCDEADIKVILQYFLIFSEIQAASLLSYAK